MIKSYKTIACETQYTLIIEKSKFICYIKGVENEEEAKEFVLSIKKQNSLATHNCYAYIADEYGQNLKFSDDGEPQGTAGKPILEALKNCELKKVCAVVTRYFGGIKLGTGGLSRAYGGVVIDCIKNSAVSIKEMAVFTLLNIDYDGYNYLIKRQKNKDFIILESNFNDSISLKIAVKESEFETFKSDLINATSSKAKIEILNKDFYCF